MNNEKYLIVIVGPTAVGKTDVCIEIAHYFKTEVISADSRQFYKEMNIGTAKPTTEEMRGIRHHFINCLSVEDEMSAGNYEREALKLLEELFEKHDILILTGGSGLYIQAVTEGFSNMPEISPLVRDALMKELEEHGLDKLLAELSENDPTYYEQVDRKNTQRIIRALEVIRTTGESFTRFRKKTDQKVKRPFNMIKVGLERDREELYERINARMDKMLDSGLEGEAKKLYSLRDKNALQTVGYSELFDYFEGKHDRDEAIRLLKRNSRRYAKRQITWFKRDQEIKWFHPDDERGIIEFIEKEIAP